MFSLQILSYLFFYIQISAAQFDDDSITINYQTGFVDGVPLPGDLSSLAFTTEVGHTIASILELNISARGDPESVIDANDVMNSCHKWTQVSTILTGLFKNETTGECTGDARAAIRAGFHDAGTWSSSLARAGQDFGGADGSLYLFGETSRAENHGLEDIVNTLGNLAEQSSVGVGDMIQFAAAHAVVTCPLGPRMRTFVGRKDAFQPAPDGLLPSAVADAETNLALFLDKEIGPLDLIALVGAHTVSRQFHFNSTRAGEFQDSTPGVWDVKFYEDTIRSDFNEGAGILTFPSDKSLSLYGPVQDEWNAYGVGLGDWREHFSRAYLRLSLAGVQTIQELTECTDALPLPITSF